MNKLLTIFTKAMLILCFSASLAYAHHTRMYVNYLTNGDISIVSGTYHTISEGAAGAGYGYNINSVHFAPDFDRAVSNTDYMAAWNAADDQYFISNAFSNTSTAMAREMGLTLTLADLIGFGVAPGGTLSFNINDSTVIWDNPGQNFSLLYNPTTTVTTTNPGGGITAVPAPSAMILLVIGLIGFMGVSRHKKQPEASQILA